MKNVFLSFFLCFALITCGLQAQEQKESFDNLSEHLSVNYNVNLTPTQINDRLTRIVESTVRVSVSGGVGTGTVFNEDEDFYYILTNAHVVGNSRTVGLEFTKNHFASPRYVGEVEKRSLLSGQAFDVAVVKLRKSSIPSHIKLPIMEIAGPNDKPRQLLMVTCGCQAGEMPSVQLTATTKQDDKLIYYLPTSRPGRSGSSLVDIEGNKIYGLVAWMTGQGRDSQGLAMTSDRIRPWVFNQSLSVSYMDNFPEDAVEIPLASDTYVEQEFEIVQKLSECDEDSCVDGVCPWDNPVLQTQEQIEVDRWLRRFGPRKAQPQTPPQQPRPGPSQPNTPSNPNNPWSNPTPEQPSEPVKPEYDGQDESNPWSAPRILPKKPEDRQDRPLLPKVDPLTEAGKIDAIYDSLKKTVEPKLSEINGKLSHVEESNRESRGLLGRLRDRVETIPTNPTPIVPDGIEERISGGILQRLFNLPIIQDLRFFARIAIYIVVYFVIDYFMPRFLGPTWIVLIFKKIFSLIAQLFSSIREGFSQLTERFSSGKEEPVNNETVEELMKKLQELMNNQKPKE